MFVVVMRVGKQIWMLSEPDTYEPAVFPTWEDADAAAEATLPGAWHSVVSVA